MTVDQLIDKLVGKPFEIECSEIRVHGMLDHAPPLYTGPGVIKAEPNGCITFRMHSQTEPTQDALKLLRVRSSTKVILKPSRIMYPIGLDGPRMKDRKTGLGLLGTLRTVPASNALEQLRAEGTIQNKHAKAWKVIRPMLAHGTIIKNPFDPVFWESRHLLIEMTYNLIFRSIGYPHRFSGPGKSTLLADVSNEN